MVSCERMSERLHLIIEHIDHRMWRQQCIIYDVHSMYSHLCAGDVEWQTTSFAAIHEWLTSHSMSDEWWHQNWKRIFSIFLLHNLIAIALMQNINSLCFDRTKWMPGSHLSSRDFEFDSKFQLYVVDYSKCVRFNANCALLVYEWWYISFRRDYIYATFGKRHIRIMHGAWMIWAPFIP